MLGGGGGLTFLVVERMTDVQIKEGNVAQSAAGAPSHVDRSKVVGLLAVTKARKEEEGKVVPRSQIKGRPELSILSQSGTFT